MATLFDDFQQRVFPKARRSNIKVSLFVDPNPEDIELANQLGTDAIELHTGTYANARSEAAQQAELERLKEAAKLAHSLGIKVNAGHGLNLDNLKMFIDYVPHLNDVSIGHALIATALFKGLAPTVKAFLAIMDDSNVRSET